MRIVDLRGPTRTALPTVEARASAAAELLRMIYVVVDRGARKTFDVGKERIDELEARLPATLVDALTTFDHDEKCFLLLSRLAVDLPEPHGVEELLTHLEADPTAAWRLLGAGQLVSGSIRWGDTLPDSEYVAARLVAGETSAITEVQRAVRQGTGQVPADSLLAEDPAAFGQQVLEVVGAAREAVWDDLAAEAMGAIERDVAHRQRQLAAGTPIERVVMEATNGYELDRDEPLHRVVLLPSFWLRPWIAVGHIGGVEVISSVVADEFVQLPSEAPPPAMLKLFKALGDESRLRLLRRMASGPITLTEATQELDVAKATAHHHLAILRQAGLVSMRSEGRGARYALRGDPPAAARDALAAYVPSRT